MLGAGRAQGALLDPKEAGDRVWKGRGQEPDERSRYTAVRG